MANLVSSFTLWLRDMDLISEPSPNNLSDEEKAAIATVRTFWDTINKSLFFYESERTIPTGTLPYLYGRMDKWMSSNKNKILSTPTLLLCQKSFNFIPDQISNFKNLKTLYLNHNNLSWLPKEFTKLCQLRVLSLATNKFTGVPLDIDYFPSLTCLDMTDNRISIPNELFWKCFQKLQIFRIVGNEVYRIQSSIKEENSTESSSTESGSDVEIFPKEGDIDSKAAANTSTLPIDPLPNIGNSCYINASLQLLFSTTDHFLYHLCEKQLQKVHHPVIPFVTTLIQQKNSRNLAAFRSALAKSGLMPDLNVISIASQQDAAFCVNALLNLVDDEQGKLQISRQRKDSSDRGQKTITETHRLLPISLPSAVESIPKNIQTLIENEFAQKWSYSKQNALLLDDGTNLETWSETSCLLNCPKYIVLHIKRFISDSGKELKKNEQELTLPENGIIDFSLVIDPMSLANQPSTLYRYIGKVIHHGKKIVTGHYTAELQKDDSWYLCNDETIKKLDHAQVGIGNAYLILLERIDK